MNRICTRFPVILLVLALTSCVAPTKQAEERDKNGNKIEYVYYTPTGSNVPIRVPRDQVQVSGSDDADAQQRALMAIQRNSAADQHQSPGGR